MSASRYALCKTGVCKCTGEGEVGQRASVSVRSAALHAGRRDPPIVKGEKIGGGSKKDFVVLST